MSPFDVLSRLHRRDQGGDSPQMTRRRPNPLSVLLLATPAYFTWILTATGQPASRASLWGRRGAGRRGASPAGPRRRARGERRSRQRPRGPARARWRNCGGCFRATSPRSSARRSRTIPRRATPASSTSLTIWDAGNAAPPSLAGLRRWPIRRRASCAGTGCRRRWPRAWHWASPWPPGCRFNRRPPRACRPTKPSARRSRRAPSRRRAGR